MPTISMGPPRCVLVSQSSATPCILGKTFSCYADAVQVRDGCRGYFMCGSALSVTNCAYNTWNASGHCPCIAREEDDAALELLTRKSCAPRVWAGVSTHSLDRPTWLHLRGTLLALLSQQVVQRATVNFWDGALPAAADLPLRSPALRFSLVAGAKGLFFKRVFTPSAVFFFELIFLFDADMHVAPAVFPLSHLFELMASTGSLLLQPSIVPAQKVEPPKKRCPNPADANDCLGLRGSRSTDWPHLRGRGWTGDCVMEAVPAVEVQATVITRGECACPQARRRILPLSPLLRAAAPALASYHSLCVRPRQHPLPPTQCLARYTRKPAPSTPPHHPSIYSSTSYPSPSSSPATSPPTNAWISSPDLIL